MAKKTLALAKIPQSFDELLAAAKQEIKDGNERETNGLQKYAAAHPWLASLVIGSVGFSVAGFCGYLVLMLPRWYPEVLAAPLAPVLWVISFLMMLLIPAFSCSFIDNLFKNRKKIANESAELANHTPASLIADYINKQTALAQNRLLGGETPLKAHREDLRKRRSELETLAAGFRVACEGEEENGSYRDMLGEGYRQACDLVRTIEASERKTDEHIRELELYFKLREERIKALRRPLDHRLLFEKLAGYRETARELVEKSETVMVASISKLIEEEASFEHLLSEAVPQAASALTAASQADLPQALATCEKLLDAAFAKMPASKEELVLLDSLNPA